MKQMGQTKSGQSLVEILIAAAILAVVLILFVSSLVNLSNAQVNSRARSKATQLAREGMEIAYNVSVRNWDTLAGMAPDTGGEAIFYPKNNSGTYDLVSIDPGAIEGKFVRQIKISHPYRDSNGLIVNSGGTIDKDTVKVTSVTSWHIGSGDENVEFTFYLINTSTSE